MWRITASTTQHRQMRANKSYNLDSLELYGKQFVPQINMVLCRTVDKGISCSSVGGRVISNTKPSRFNGVIICKI